MVTVVVVENERGIRRRLRPSQARRESFATLHENPEEISQTA